jgi:hypothetical protein
MLKENKNNFDEFGRDVQALRRLMWWCFIAATPIAWYLTWGIK